MQPTFNEDRTLSELDHVRISRLLQRDPRMLRNPAVPTGSPLHEVLEGADLVSPREMPPEVVTMYSRVSVEDTATGKRSVLTLCYPEDTDPAEGFVSVLSPIGAALLGKRVGEIAEPGSPGSAPPPLRILEILFQPEASGDFTL
ncbi:GreA/GreB family elongation factor [Quisquiliibacterium transsilvanicum]|jgi:regulator of nucleoside diphosphate kinase|uniref:Regulator of nucleoside diphosphate kinase n=1 Tax=Quisquiliibacterium transsilvanicum TaxID=1549638 RepID=A0A7W8HKZ3_9BURK|nr:GreA/GreB family elongation factor [Quisquiliibacterium transsilvanicum]MBB5273030.1 regulator of nucleoside diphosphate kinase [Quisquiliibacterium transsilvanicum]